MARHVGDLAHIDSVKARWRPDRDPGHAPERHRSGTGPRHHPIDPRTPRVPTRADPHRGLNRVHRRGPAWDVLQASTRVVESRSVYGRLAQCSQSTLLDCPASTLKVRDRPNRQGLRKPPLQPRMPHIRDSFCNRRVAHGGPPVAGSILPVSAHFHALFARWAGFDGST